MMVSCAVERPSLDFVEQFHRIMRNVNFSKVEIQLDRKETNGSKMEVPLKILHEIWNTPVPEFCAWLIPVPTQTTSR